MEYKKHTSVYTAWYLNTQGIPLCMFVYAMTRTSYHNNSLKIFRYVPIMAKKQGFKCSHVRYLIVTKY